MNRFDHNLLNPLLRDIHTHQITELLSAFPSLQSIKGSLSLSLWKYIERRPQRFFSHHAFAVYFDRLIELDKADKQALLSFLRDQSLSINNAYRHADEVCEANWHDQKIVIKDDYDLLVNIDQYLHPAYLRLTEAVFRPLLRLPAHFSRLKCVHFDTKNFSNSRSSSNLGHNRETNRCGSALIRSMKALQASKRWRMEA